MNSHGEVLEQIGGLERRIASLAQRAETVESDAARIERARDALPAVRPYANSLLAYFWEPRSLPPVPPPFVGPDVAPIRSERTNVDHISAGPAYRDDAIAARTQLATLEEQLDQMRTRVARAEQRRGRAHREFARRAERALRDDSFSLKEWIQLLVFLAITGALLYACSAAVTR